MAAPMKKHVYQFILPNGVFLSIFDIEVMGLVPKYYLLTADTIQVSIFFVTQDKNE